jgi:hypothetical protein
MFNSTSKYALDAIQTSLASSTQGRCRHSGKRITKQDKSTCHLHMDISLGQEGQRKI